MKTVLVIAALLLATTGSLAQQVTTPKKAPAGCIPCEALCRLCANRGLQKKDTTDCEAGCRSWGAMVGLKQVYVHRNLSLCGKGNYAPRCN